MGDKIYPKIKHASLSHDLYRAEIALKLIEKKHTLPGSHYQVFLMDDLIASGIKAMAGLQGCCRADLACDIKAMAGLEDRWADLACDMVIVELIYHVTYVSELLKALNTGFGSCEEHLTFGLIHEI